MGERTPGFLETTQSCAAAETGDRDGWERAALGKAFWDPGAEREGTGDRPCTPRVRERRGGEMHSWEDAGDQFHQTPSSGKVSPPPEALASFVFLLFCLVWSWLPMKHEVVIRNLVH